jgi:hypothetical protein
MQKKPHHNNLYAALVGIGILGLAGCGDDSGKSPSTASAPQQVVSKSEHQIFEKKYVEKCVKSQQKSSDTQLTNDQELGEVCECMAKEISKNLNHADAVHFNQKNEFPVELVLMTQAAGNHCLSQQKK